MTTDPLDTHSMLMDGEPAMPILVAEYNALVARVNEAESRLAAPALLSGGALHDRIASALHDADEHSCQMQDGVDYPTLAAAVVGVLAADTRAGVLREAADEAEGLRQFEPASGARKSAQVSENVGILRVADHLRRLAAETPEPAPALTIRYRNHRGETAVRTIRPVRLWYGATPWHPDEQWLLQAVDVGKGTLRDFAVADLQGARSAETPQAETEAYPPVIWWVVETRDSAADQWGFDRLHTDRQQAVDEYDALDGTVERRIVRGRTTYTVAAECTPAAETQDAPPVEVAVGDGGTIYGESVAHIAGVEGAADDEETPRPAPGGPFPRELRVRVLREELARMEGSNGDGDSAAEDVPAVQVRAVFAEIAAEMQPRTGTEGARR